MRRNDSNRIKGMRTKLGGRENASSAFIMAREDRGE